MYPQFHEYFWRTSNFVCEAAVLSIILGHGYIRVRIHPNIESAAGVAMIEFHLQWAEVQGKIPGMNRLRAAGCEKNAQNQLYYMQRYAPHVNSLPAR